MGDLPKSIKDAFDDAHRTIDRAAGPPQWEYLITADTHQPRLNELGAEGWELVAVSTAVRFEPMREVERWLYLKRRRRD